MGNNEETKSSKTEKTSPPATPEPNNVHVYHDWATLQAYYGPRVVPPYYNSAISSGHAPSPYIWGPAQPMIPPYGAPYAAIYSHGGVYGHPAVPLGSHPPSLGFLTSPVAATTVSIETPTKSSGSDRGLMKKLKSVDGLTMSIGNENVDSADGGADHAQSQSSETEGSSDGNTSGADKTRRKRSREGTPSTGEEKGEAQAKLNGEAAGASDKVLGTAATHPGATVLSPGMTTALELRNPVSMKASSTSIPQTAALVTSEAWIQNERELKRERRKQSNRESARRSRLRKQAETEELAKKVESLTAENLALKSEISRLTENSENLRQENALLTERLENVQTGQKDSALVKLEGNRAMPDNTENLLARVNNSASINRSNEEAEERYDRNANSGAKLHRLLDSKGRTDAVAAG